MDQPRFLAAVPALAVSDERRAVAFLVDALGFVELTHDGRGLGILRRDVRFGPGWKRLMRLSWFAHLNGMTYTFERKIGHDVGTLFSIGKDGVARDILTVNASALNMTRDTETPPGSGIDIKLVYRKAP